MVTPNPTAARHLESRQLAVLESIRNIHSRVFGNDLTELECRQAKILSRIARLNQTLNSWKETKVAGSEVVCCESGDFDGGAGLEFEKVTSEKVYGRLRSRDMTSGSENFPDPMADAEDGRDSDVDNAQDTEARLTMLLRRTKATFEFKRVPPDYYGRSFEERKTLLGAASIDHLCKSIVMVNTQADESVKDCRDRNNSKYYLVVIQYTARLNAEKVKNFVHSLNGGKISRKRFNMRLAPEEESNRLTGFEHNAVTPFGMLYNIPVILSDAIVKLKPEFFWLGGGEVDLKLGIKTPDLVKIINPFIADCIY